MHLIQSICQRSLVLDRGEIVFDGPTAGAIEAYARLNENSKMNAPAAASNDPTDANPVVIDALSVEAVDAAEICSGGSIRLTLAYRALRDMESVTWGFSLWTRDLGVRIATSVAKYDGKNQQLRCGKGVLSCIVRNLPLVPRTYCVKSGIYDCANGWPIARFGWENAAAEFEIKGATTEVNSRHRIDNDIIDLDVRWLS
jgi:hypothetical protein